MNWIILLLLLGCGCRGNGCCRTVVRDDGCCGEGRCQRGRNCAGSVRREACGRDCDGRREERDCGRDCAGPVRREACERDCDGRREERDCGRNDCDGREAPGMIPPPWQDYPKFPRRDGRGDCEACEASSCEEE